MSVGIHPRAPDFLIIGAQKCGTSALRRNLEAHEAIAMATGEVHFFNRPVNWRKGFDWYLDHFTHPDKLQGEKTPDYLDNPASARRIAEHLPGAKLIVLLRDPVTRAYSHWNHMMQRIEDTSRRGWEKVSFEDAIDRASRGDEPFARLLDKGRYVDHLDTYAREFPREQVFIGIQERFLQDGTRELARVFRFLGVEPLPIEPAKVHVRTYDTPINPAIRQQLLEFFAPYNRRLFEWLGEGIAEWSAP